MTRIAFVVWLAALACASLPARAQDQPKDQLQNQPEQVAPHHLGVDLASGKVHVGFGDQASLIRLERDPLGEE